MGNIGDRDPDDEAARIFRIGIRRGMNRVIVVLCIDRIDRDQRQVAPVFAARKRGRTSRLRFGQRLAETHMRNVERGGPDEARGALGLERAAPLLHWRGLQADPPVAGEFHRDEVSVLRVGGRARRNGKFAAELLLVDRLQPAPAIRQHAEDAELALPDAIQNFDDAAGVTDRAFLADFFGAQQRAIADAWNFIRARLARDVDADTRRRAVLFGVPFGRNGNQFAITIALGDVGEHHSGKGAGVMQLLAPPIDCSFFGEVAEHVAQRSAIRILEAESARDLAHAGLALVRADEGDDLFAGRKAGRAVLLGGLLQDDAKVGIDWSARQPGLIRRRSWSSLALQLSSLPWQAFSPRLAL